MQKSAFIGHDVGAFLVVRSDDNGILLPAVRLAIGDWLELWVAGDFQWVQVCSGGYKGFFYRTQVGTPGRFAVGMQVRACGLSVHKDASGMSESHPACLVSVAPSVS